MIKMSEQQKRMEGRTEVGKMWKLLSVRRKLSDDLESSGPPTLSYLKLVI